MFSRLCSREDMSHLWASWSKDRSDSSQASDNLGNLLLTQEARISPRLVRVTSFQALTAVIVALSLTSQLKFSPGLFIMRASTQLIRLRRFLKQAQLSCLPFISVSPISVCILYSATPGLIYVLMQTAVSKENFPSLQTIANVSFFSFVIGQVSALSASFTSKAKLASSEPTKYGLCL